VHDFAEKIKVLGFFVEFAEKSLHILLWQGKQEVRLKVYREKYNPPISLRTSMRDYREESWLINVPLYAIGVKGCSVIT